jgi:glycine oxidase
MEPSLTFDVAVIGGGVIGCAIAWRLQQIGLRTAIIERGEPGREASLAAGGMLAPFAETDQRDAFFELAVESRFMYADFARELRETTGIDVEYRTEGTLYLSLTDEDDEELEHRWSWQSEVGLRVTKLTPADALQLEPQINPRLRWALKFPDDHQVDNRRLVRALIAAARKAGVKILPSTEARHLRIESNAGMKQVAGLSTTRGEILARTVVIAAGSWSGLITTDEPIALSNARVEPVRGQMVAMAMPAPEVGHVIYSRRGYIVPRLGGYLIAGSTTERVGYDKSVTAGGVSGIIERATEILPVVPSLSITETWAGLRPFAVDGWPILGADPQVAGLHYATGHYRNGILLAPITARVMSELIARGESQRHLTPFSVARFANRAVAG